MEKAERYRLLNDPAQAESICHDVLARRRRQPGGAALPDPVAHRSVRRERRGEFGA